MPQAQLEIETGEERQSSGYRCDGLAEVYAIQLGSLFRGRIQAISEDGCYVATSAPLRLEPSHEVDLLFNLKNRIYQTAARVLSVSPGDGIGLEFLVRDSRTRDSVKKLVGSFAAAAAPTAFSE